MIIRKVTCTFMVLIILLTIPSSNSKGIFKKKIENEVLKREDVVTYEPVPTAMPTDGTRTPKSTDGTGPVAGYSVVTPGNTVRPTSGHQDMVTHEDAWHWSYQGDTGPSQWHTHYESCAKTSQSPININTGNTVYDSLLDPFFFGNYDNPTGLTLINNGHAIQVNVEGDLFIENGALSNKHKLAQFHFHWGSTENGGSEHTINDQHYPMEAHFVHYNNRYSSLSEAADKPDGLAVLGFFFEVVPETNSKYNAHLVNKLTEVSYKDEQTSIPTFDISALLPAELTHYYRYKGSLTTPGCFESVTWTVFKDPVPISKSQLDKFRSVKADYNTNATEPDLEDNYRPVQALNGRTVYFSISPAPMIVPSLVILFIALLPFVVKS